MLPTPSGVIPIRPLGLIDAHHQLRGRLHHTVEHVLEPLDSFQIGGEPFRIRFQRIQRSPNS